MNRWKTLGSLLLLAAATFSAAAQLRETPISAPSLGPAEAYQNVPLAATDGTDFLAVWNDYRGGTFGTRITHDGRVLDPTGLFIGGMPRALLWCGGVYVLVYSASDNRSAGIIRLSRGGKVIDGPRDITNSYVITAATNGSTIVLAGTKITVLDDRARFVEEVAPPVFGPFEWTVASNGSTYEIVSTIYTNGHNSVVATALDAGGHVGKSLFFQAPAAQVLVTPSGSTYRVFFGDLQKDVVMTFDTSSDPAQVTPLLARVSTHAVVTTPSGYLLATRGESDLELRVARGSGDTIVDPQPFATTSTPAFPTDPAFAAAGDKVLLVWSDTLSDDANVRGVMLDSNGHQQTPAFDLTLSAKAQHSPAIATGAANDLVAWQESSGIHVSRVSPAGVPLDGSGIQLSTTGVSPMVLRDDGAYVVYWFSDGAVDLRWIDASSGRPIGGTIVIDIPAVTGFSLGRDDHGMVLFFTDGYGHMEAQRVGPAGAIGSPVRLAPDPFSGALSAALWNGHEWLVVWEESRLLPLPTGIPLFASTMKAERVLESLNVIDSQPLQIVDFPSGAGATAFATDGDDFFIAWSRNDSSESLGVHARTVSAAGVLSEPSLLVSANDETEVKAATWDGSGYAVAYAQRRDHAFYAHRLMLTHAGVGDQLVISTATLDQREVALAATPGRPLRAAYTHVATEPEYGYVSRVFIRDLVYARRRIAAH